MLESLLRNISNETKKIPFETILNVINYAEECAVHILNLALDYRAFTKTEKALGEAPSIIIRSF